MGFAGAGAVPGLGNAEAPASGRRRVAADCWPSLGNTFALARGAPPSPRWPAGLIVAWAGRACAKAQPGVKPGTRPRAHRHAWATRCRARCWPSACSTPLALDRPRAVGPEPSGCGRLLLMGSHDRAGMRLRHPLPGACRPAALEAGLARIPPSLEQASRLLGETTPRHAAPRAPAAAAARAGRQRRCWCSSDAMKEQPATLLLRPCNFDTLGHLALRRGAPRGTYEEGAVAALAIVAGRPICR